MQPEIQEAVKIAHDELGTVAPAGTYRVTRRWRPLSFLSVLLVLVGWELLSLVLPETATGYKRVPGIEDVLGSFLDFAGYWKGGLGAPSTRTGAEPTYWGATLGLVYNTAASFLRVTAGYLLGLGVGVFLAFLISWSRTARELLSFPAHLARMMPLLAMLPLFALWFGNSEFGTVMFVAFAMGILMFVIAVNAIANVPGYYEQFARSLGASRARSYARVVFPAIIPQLRTGILLGVAFSWSAVLAAEFLGKQSGLGHILNFALYYAATDTIALTGLVVVLISATSYLLVRKVMLWVTRWAE